MASVLLWGRQAATTQRALSAPRGLKRLRNRMLKAWIEWIVAAALVVILAPVLAWIAWNVRRDKGPALFVQTREGMNGRPIRVFKFRSMAVRACDASPTQSVALSDPGVTPFGRWLRRTGLDELPQLFNVLNGSMSLIGPRPHVGSMLVEGVPYRVLVPGYDERLLARPGLTGLAQVRGFCGPVCDMTHGIARVAADREYVDTWSVWLDISIVLRTVALIFSQLTKRDAR